MASAYAERATGVGRALGLGPVEIIEVEARKPGKQAEAEVLSPHFADAHVIACDEHGKGLTSRELANRLAQLRDQGNRHTVFVIGGADGVAKSVIETALGAVREAVGGGTIQHQGDAGDSIYWLCYRRAQHRLWVVSSGEMGGRDHRVTEIVEELTEKDTETSTDCAIIPEKFAPLVFDGKLHLGMSRLEVVTALGPPSKSEAAQMVYSHDGKLADGFDETAWLILRFREEKLVSMRGGKTTTN